jgi:hypothetical protein
VCGMGVHLRVWQGMRCSAHMLMCEGVGVMQGGRGAVCRRACHTRVCRQQNACTMLLR